MVQSKTNSNIRSTRERPEKTAARENATRKSTTRDGKVHNAQWSAAIIDSEQHTQQRMSHKYTHSRKLKAESACPSAVQEER
ncbi:hypothetical protein WMY93_032456, partial [Mugilogobius chulae]